MNTQTSELCPKCGLYRQNALENHNNGDPTAWNLLQSCPECWKWLVSQYQHINNPQSNSAVDTALAGILEIISIGEDNIHMNPLNIPDSIGGIRAVLEALYEDAKEGKAVKP